MNEHSNQFPEQLFDLFSSKTFSELTESERELVLAHTTEKEYKQLAESVLSFSTLDNSIEIDAPGITLVKLKKAEVKSWWSYRIPLYQAIAASITLTVACLTILQFSGKKTMDSATNTTNSFTLRSSPLDEKAIDRHLAEIKLLVNKKSSPVGTSLANENYPRGLIFDF